MSAIIMDFDGTIANSFDYVVAFLAGEAGVKVLDDDLKDELRNMSMLAMARTLGVPLWRLPLLFFKGRTAMGRSIKLVEPFDGMPELIVKLHNEGHALYILSSNLLRNVHEFLHKHDLHTNFLEIYGGVGLFGKAPALRKLLREQNLAVEDCIYIGDELRDVEAAQSVGMKVVAVTWGFARTADLEAKEPTALALAPLDLLRILEEEL